jgi:putative transposon-encoded protein|tara:strand:- start:2196 stop:2330 length:135 start_codon:yes stop_codon:yes gene_type:complete
MVDKFSINGEEVIRRTVTKYGSSAKVGVPKKWEGRDVKIVLLPM